MIRRTTRRSPARLVARAALPVAFGLAAVGLAAACAKKIEPIPMQTAPVTRRNISVETQSTGVVEPINLIEVKSKASGLITRMPVDVGSVVKPGDLILRMSNPDVAAQLFLSPRTIDYHLRKVFTKLDIAARTELATVDLGDA